MNDRQLLFCLARLRAMGRDTLARVILVDLPEVDFKTLADETAELSDNIDWKLIDKICELCDSPVPAMHLVICRLEQEAVYEQSSKRLSKSKAGAEILRMYGNRVKPTGLDDLHKALKVEKISSYKREKYSADDLKAIAVKGALEAFKQIGETSKSEGPQRPYPLTPLAQALPVDPEVWKQWEMVNGAMESQDSKMMQEYYLPARQGQKISERARQALKDYFESWKAKKRAAKMVPLHDARKEAVLPPWETARKSVSYLDAKRAYQIASERYKEKGPRFLNALKETGDVKEASRRAGISRQMGHRYLVEIRKELCHQKK
jgi:hypothetical protein